MLSIIYEDVLRLFVHFIPAHETDDSITKTRQRVVTVMQPFQVDVELFISTED